MPLSHVFVIKNKIYNENVMEMREIEEIEIPDFLTFENKIRAEAKPVVIRGFANNWPVVLAGKNGSHAFIEYIKKFSQPEILKYATCPPQFEGCFHYNSDMQSFNFDWQNGTFNDFLNELIIENKNTNRKAIALQGLEIAKYLKDFEKENFQELRPNNRGSFMWLSNQSKVATHNDPYENIAIVVFGTRRFTLFPPDQIGNLYIGPLHFTPAGTPISMVHLTNPDYGKYPKFKDALEHAQYVDLQPGDALYIPYHWYHHVESKQDLNVLVNYWWSDARHDIGSPWDAMLHAMLSFGNLPEGQRQTWRHIIDHFAFYANGDPWAHLPTHAKGPLVDTKPEDTNKIRATIIDNFKRR